MAGTMGERRSARLYAPGTRRAAGVPIIKYEAAYVCGLQVSIGTGGVAVAVAIVAAVVFATAPPGQPQYAFAEASPILFSLTEISRITNDDGLNFYGYGGVMGIVTFESDGRAYAAVTSDRRMQVLDLADPHNITLAGRIDDLASRYVAGGIKAATFESDGRAHLAVVSGEGVQVLDLTDPYDIVLADSISHDFGIGVIGEPGIATFESNGRAYAIVSTFMGDGACVPLPPSLYDCPDYDDTTILQVLDLTDPHDIFPTVRIVYDGLHPYHSAGIATFESDGHTYAVVTAAIFEIDAERFRVVPAGNTYTVVVPYDDVQVLNLTDPNHIVPAGHIADDDNLFLKYARLVATFESDGRAYAAVVSSEGVQVLNLTDPNHIVPAGHIAHGAGIRLNGATNIATFESDGRAYAAVSTYGGVQVLNLTDPNHIVPAVHFAHDDGPRPGDPRNTATFESDGRAYAVVGLNYDVRVIQLTANADHAAHGSGPGDTAYLTITTHNPVCTALVLDALGATRFTDIYPSYSADDMVDGVNVTAVIWARDANMTMAALVGQPEVSRVAAYLSVPQNAMSERPTPLAPATDPDADMSGSIRGCSKNVAYDLATHAMASIGWAGAQPGTGPKHLSDTSPAGASGSGDGPETESESLTLDPHPGSRLEGELYFSLEGSFVSVGIWTHDIRATWAFVQENGGLITSVPRDYGDRPLGARSLMGSYLPPELLGSLMLRDEISAINAGGPPILEQ